MQDKQSECSLTDLIDYINMHCWVSLLYSRIVFSMKTIIFNDNHYLASAIYQLKSNVSENPLISQALISRLYIRGISDQDITFSRILGWV